MVHANSSLQAEVYFNMPFLRPFDTLLWVMLNERGCIISVYIISPLHRINGTPDLIVNTARSPEQNTLFFSKQGNQVL